MAPMLRDDSSTRRFEPIGGDEKKGFFLLVCLLHRLKETSASTKSCVPSSIGARYASMFVVPHLVSVPRSTADTLLSSLSSRGGNVKPTHKATCSRGIETCPRSSCAL